MHAEVPRDLPRAPVKENYCMTASRGQRDGADQEDWTGDPEL